MRFPNNSIAARAVWILGLLAWNGISGCSLTDLVGDSKVPAGTADPAVVASPEGALGLYVAAQQRLATAMQDYAFSSGLLGDELRPTNIGPLGTAEEISVIDSRYLPGVNQTVVLNEFQYTGEALYKSLQQVRGASQEARGAVRAYAPLVPRDILGHLYALEGFANVLLADLYCSGIPLSTVNFGGDFTIKPGSTTEEVYRSATALFDSAIALATDSMSILYLARIGKARALLALGEYQAIEAVVGAIPESYQYQLLYRAPLTNRFRMSGTAYNTFPSFSVSDGEGVDQITGIRYVSLNDPRVRVRVASYSTPERPYYFPAKYDSTGTTPIIAASGIEGRLILAEAQQHTGGPWLTTLNTLRTSCGASESCVDPAPAGSGGITGLPPEPDPGNARDRTLLLFRERALWLFLTGHRQGDMRRLIRNYEVPEAQIYATGSYYGSNAAGVYGSSVNFAVPQSEQSSNIHYRGCFNRDA